MVRQAFDLLGHPLPDEALQGLDNPGVQAAPPLLQEAFVGHLMGQGVLEGVFDLGEEARLIQELGGLQMREAQADLSPEEIEEQNEGFLRWRDCMIERGWKIGEPKPDSEGRLFSFGGGGGSQLKIEPPPGEDLMGSEDMQACSEEAQ